MGKSTCSFNGCDRPHYSKGLCSGHYAQKRRGWDLCPLRPSSIGIPVEQRFWAKVQKTDGCWEWNAATDSHGYGQIRINGRNVLAHRFSWELSNGPIPEGMFLDHRCSNPPCVNPSHLRIVTQSQNMQHLARIRSDSTSGVRGVSWEKRQGAWRVQVQTNGRNYWGGYHSTLEAADEAARALRAELHTHDDHDEWLRRNGRSA